MYTDSGSLHFVIYSGGTPYHVISSSPLTGNSWHHVAGVFDSSSGVSKVYIDGSLSNTFSSIPGLPDSIILPYEIGGFSAYGSNLDGLIDEVAIFNQALSGTDVQSIYNAGSTGMCRPCTAQPSNLVAWWQGENSARDRIGTHNGTLVSGATYGQGIVGSAFSFTGGGAGVSVPASSDWAFGTGDFAISFWAYSSNFDDHRPLINNRSASASNNMWAVEIYPVANRVEFHSGLTIYLTATNLLTNSSWNHIAVTRSSGTLNIYINGILSGSASNSADFSEINELEIGRDIMSGNDLGGKSFQGFIDEIQIFKRGLSASEIDAIYNAGSAGICSACTPVPSGLISWWGGDNNALDIVGTNNGTLVNGAAYAPGKVSQAFSFDGVNDYVEISGGAGDFGSSPFTVDFWMYTSIQGNNSFILGKNNANSGIGWDIRLDNQAIQVVGVNGWGFNITSDASVTPNSWHHIALSSSITDVNLYIDGVLKGHSARSSISATTNPLRIGYAATDYYYGGTIFSGLIDELQIFNRALSSSEIAAIYNSGGCGTCRPSAAPPSGLVSWWRAENDASDAQGSNNGTLMNGASFDQGKVGQAFSLDGVDDYVLIGDPVPASLQIQNEISIEAWIYASSNFVYDLQLIAGSQYDANHAGASIFLTQSGSDGFAGLPDPHIHFQIGDGTSWHATSANAQVPLNQWVHIAATRKAGEDGKIYYNGVLQPSVGQAWPSGNISYAGSWFAIGQQKGVNRPFKGLVDEARVYNRAISLTEIQTIYNSGSTGMTFTPDTTPDPFNYIPQTGVPLNTTIVSNTVTVTGINYPASISITACTGTACEYQINGGSWTSVAGTVNNGDTVKVHQTSSSSNSILTTATLTIGDVSGAFNVTTASAIDPDANGLIAWWQAENNAFDSIGGRDGVWSGTAAYGPGIAGQAFSLDGVNSEVSVPAFDMGSDWTITAWMNPHSCSDNLHCPIVTRSQGNQDGLLLLYHGPNHSKANQFGLIIGNGVWQVLLYSNAYSLGAWHQVTASKYGDTYSLYVDGVLKDKQSIPGVAADYQSCNVEIGHWYYNVGQGYTNGLIDEVKIFNRALTAKEVLKLAEPNGLVSWWRGEDNAADSTGNNDGTWHGTEAYIQGRTGKAFSFNGAGSYLTVPDDPSLHPTTALTLEAWINPSDIGPDQHIISTAGGGPSPFGHDFYLRLYGGKLELRINDDPLTASGVIPMSNRWYYIVATYDQEAGERRIYVDGVLKASNLYSSAINTGHSYFSVGVNARKPAYGGDFSSFKGIVDEVRIYNRALSAAEV
ncbi:MAG TPA: LamG domain-containing protein, partial [Dissulfurispiraceae bacterium]|nr:LamG domain-containing protein [Dissulfurispiraceae bacterium]